ncbi:twin-arginine translocase subunit TatC, partial [Aliarcobacter butzleri]
IGIVDDRMLKDFFRYAIVLIFIVAAVLTPPDVISQVLMAAPLVLLYGISIYIAKVFNPASKDEEEDDEEE